MTCNDGYILFVVLLAAMEERHREASGCVQMLCLIYSA